MYLGFTDLVSRWVYTRQGVHRLSKSADFPAPAFTINQGRTKVWRSEDIEAYEETHPEVLQEWAKTRKVVGYFLAVQKKGTTQEPQPKRRTLLEKLFPNASGGDI